MLTSISTLARAAGWFSHSGIQESNGGVARYHRTDSGRNALISTEITGYAVSTFTFMHSRLGDAELLRSAGRAAGFLMHRAWDRELAIYPFEYAAPDRTPEALAYFFDSGIIVRGLLTLWRTTRSEEVLANARATGRSMHDFDAENLFHPILRLPGKEPLPYEVRWSRGPGCYQLKSALAWRELYNATGERQFEDSYQRALRQAIAVHEQFLPAPEGPEKTMDRLHAYCYFLEALLADAESQRAILEDGIQRVSGYLRKIRGVFERSDVNAQLLRIRLLAEKLAGVPLNKDEAEEEAAAILGFQDDSGGFWFGRNRTGFLPFLNPVSTAFCAQALEMWEDRQARRDTGSPQDLI